jgi:hypothetical protein
MIKKIEYENKIWSELGTPILPKLISKFEEKPETDSDIFYEIVDYIWDSGVCEPIFFVVVPHLINIASKLEFYKSKNLWCYLGSWISTHKKYRKDVSEEVLDIFYSSLSYAENICIKLISNAGKLDDSDAAYLYASLFAFSNHVLGYMTMSSYKDDLEGTSITKCDNGHLNDITVYNSGIVLYEEKEQPKRITEVDLNSIQYHFEKNDNNPWILFVKDIQRLIENENISKAVRSHLELSEKILKYGVKPDLPIKYAFSLYGSLLLCNDSIEVSNRVFHGWDSIRCKECGMEFIFADGWYESC